jgi:hypothetical protein
MVVVPTDTEVKLTYSKTPLDWFFYSLTFLGIALCFYWRRQGDLVYAGERPDWRRSGSTGTDEVADTTSSSVVGGDPWFDVPPAPTDGDR